MRCNCSCRRGTCGETSLRKLTHLRGGDFHGVHLGEEGAHRSHPSPGPLETGRGDTLEGAVVDVTSRYLLEGDTLLIRSAWPPLAQIGKASLEEPYRVGAFC